MPRFLLAVTLLVGALFGAWFSLALRSPRVEGRVLPLEWTETPVPARAVVLHEESGLRFLRASGATFIASHRGTLQLDAVDWRVVRHDQAWWWALGLLPASSGDLLFVMSDDDGASFRTSRVPSPGGQLLETQLSGARFVATFEGMTLGPPWVWAPWLPARRPSRIRLVTTNAGRSWRLEL